MARINDQTWIQAATYVDNYLKTGDINGKGNAPKPAPNTPERLITYFYDMYEPIRQQNGGSEGSTHVSTGTGGMLVALLDRHTNREQARRIADDIVNRGSITLSNGEVVPLGVDTSRCTNAALKDFINQRGVFAGRL
jgi:hypothetical protein